MSLTNVDNLTKSLESTRVSPSGVTFAGKSLKLDTEHDAKPIIEAINKCSNLQYLNLEGNTLGVEASNGISKALEKHPEFKRALWKDMFTGRMKTEIPRALEMLGKGLVTATARLTELDMSDNAFGPIGVEGLAMLLRSSSCYALEELRLNNNGLGITGGKLLANALTDCYICSKRTGHPLALKVFIAGRNRLENEGATELATVFKMIGTLEEIALPQNGIYHAGITALANAFVENKNLAILNLNDNTISEKGAAAIAKVLPSLNNLKSINFGDCLLKTRGAIALAKCLKDGHEKLEELFLGHNEIRFEGGLELVNSLFNKKNLKVLNLNGNQFGTKGVNDIKTKIMNLGKLNALESLSENESEDSDEGSPDDEVDDYEVPDRENDEEHKSTETKLLNNFLTTSTAECFLALGSNRAKLLLDASKKNGEINLESILPILMNVSALVTSEKENVTKPAQEISEILYGELFTWAEKTNKVGEAVNIILVNLELIKNEDKKFKPRWNTQGGINVLKNCIEKIDINENIKTILNFVLNRSKIGNSEV